MNYLAKAALCTTASSITGNFMGRPAHIPLLIHLALKGLLPSRSVGTSTKDPKNPDANIINLTHIEGYDAHGHNEKKVFKHTKPDFSPYNREDIIAIGICAVAPLIFSGFLNPTLRNSNEFHITAGFVGSAVSSFLMRLGREEPTKKNNI